tara:strand:+ start:22140 stop:22436 length:297 start_codon:yes stop_codon:yes gene_type:complete
MNIQAQEELDFVVSTEAEADQAYAYGLGAERTDVEWILSDRDAWYRNPSYTGVKGAHPEADEQEMQEAAAAEDEAAEATEGADYSMTYWVSFDHDIPF